MKLSMDVTVRTLSAALLAVAAFGLGCRESDAAGKKSVALASPEGAESKGTISAHVDGKNFKIDTEVGECKVGAECTAKVKLAAQGGYHINKEYPYKILMAPDKNVDFLGKSEKEIFSKTLGDFAAEEKEAVMTVRFTPKAAGDFVLKGNYKLSVCSEQNCQLETQEVALEVKSKR